MSTRLERITIHNTLNSLEELLAFEEAPIPWPKLRELDCSNNSIPEIHKSMVRSLACSFALINAYASLRLLPSNGLTYRTT